MTELTSAQELFKGRHFDQEIIVLCVRRYLIPRRVQVRSCKYLNNVIEQDHRRMARPMASGWIAILR